MGYSAKQRKVKVSLEGGQKLVKRLKAMDTAASAILMKAAKAGGEVALEDAKKNCPVDTGALRDSLKMSENVSKPTKADVKIDYDKTLKYGTFVELGARGRPAKPFMREAVDGNQDKINQAITETLAEAVGRKM
jgi:HK97 gp10 family phage protein